MTPRVLLTGANGLVGRAVLPALRALGLEVVAMARTASDPEQLVCDLEDARATLRIVRDVSPTHVIHLAGGVASSVHALYRRNVLTTVHVLEAAAELASPPRCVLMGSAAEYGESAPGAIAETAPLRPINDYGRAKAAQSLLAQAIAAARGLPLTILRPFNVVSPELPLSTALGRMRSELLGSSARERRVRCGRLDIVRDFVPLATLVETIARWCGDAPASATINVCSGRGIALAAVLDAMARRLGVIAHVEQLEELVGMPAADRVVGDPTLLREFLGATPQVSPETLAVLMVG